MHKILIVDDEILVRVGLKSSIDWEKYGFLVVGEAQNGKEALDRYSHEQIDILITDIAMPEMDGLELIKHFIKINKNLKIIILSHYENFAYAKEAIKLGVSRYILKSDLQPSNLIKILLELTDNKEIDNLQIQEDDLFVRNNKYLELILNNKMFDEYKKIKLLHNQIFIVKFQITYDNNQRDMGKNTVINSIIDSTIKDINYCYYYVRLNNKKKYVILFDFEKNNYDMIFIKLKELELNINQLLNAQIAFEYEKRYYDASELLYVLSKVSSSENQDNNMDNNNKNYSYFVKKAIKYIEIHFNENISLKSVADYCDLNASYFSSLFKKEIGVSFSKYLTKVRIDTAKNLLLSTNMKFYEISNRVGFENQYYFSKVFKETTNLTCSEFRNINYLHKE